MDPVTFGPFAFNRGKGTLTREGKHVALGVRSSALMMALLDAEGSVVSKADLMERVWPGTSVEEGNLTVQVAALRKALGQRADNSDWIVTVARIGYRLWAEDAEAPREAASPLPALAVLPFHNLSGDAAHAGVLTFGSWRPSALCLINYGRSTSTSALVRTAISASVKHNVERGFEPEAPAALQFWIDGEEEDRACQTEPIQALCNGANEHPMSCSTRLLARAR